MHKRGPNIEIRIGQNKNSIFVNDIVNNGSHLLYNVFLETAKQIYTDTMRETGVLNYLLNQFIRNETESLKVPVNIQV